MAGAYLIPVEFCHFWKRANKQETCRISALDSVLQVDEQPKETYGCVAQRCGFADQTGRVVIEPEFEEVAEFSEGLAGFATNLDGGAFTAAVHRIEQHYKETGIEVD